MSKESENPSSLNIFKDAALKKRKAFDIESENDLNLMEDVSIGSVQKSKNESKSLSSKVDFSINITISFGRIEKLKKERKNLTKSIYKNNVPYDNNQFPDARFPTYYSVPTHLFEEFKRMFPQNTNQKGKISLIPDKEIGGKSYSLLSWLVHSHWKNTENLDNLAKIILHKKPITLSHLDWLCTNYSKTYDVRYKLNQNNPVDFSIHDSYNQRLELHLRAFFDVFARNARILVEWITDDEEFFNSFVGDKEDSLGEI